MQPHPNLTNILYKAILSIGASISVIAFVWCCNELEQQQKVEVDAVQLDFVQLLHFGITSLVLL